MIKTITFDDAKYRLVPIEPTEEIRTAIINSEEILPFEIDHIWAAGVMAATEPPEMQHEILIDAYL